MTNVLLTDDRLVSIASESLDGKVQPVPVKLPPVVGGLSVRRSGNVALFKTGELKDGTPIEVAVMIENETAVFFPQRSSAHKQLLATLGIEE